MAKKAKGGEESAAVESTNEDKISNAQKKEIAEKTIKLMDDNGIDATQRKLIKGVLYSLMK